MAKTIRFVSEFQIIVQYLIRFEMKKTLFAQHYNTHALCCNNMWKWLAFANMEL